MMLIKKKKKNALKATCKTLYTVRPAQSPYISPEQGFPLFHLWHIQKIAVLVQAHWGK